MGEFTWNAEEQITVAGGVTYTYDGDGLRVKKSNGKLYWRSIGMDVLAETDLAGNNPVEFIYFAGQRVAARHYAGGGQDYYIFSDHLGSARVITSATGAVCGDADYLPFGAERATYSCWVSYKFTGYERDPETGLDYAIFRYYNSRLGRFMPPDILTGGGCWPTLSIRNQNWCCPTLVPPAFGGTGWEKPNTVPVVR